ncbi:hypothetical protein ACL2XP_05580 [Sodalis sp. RH21]|uniref:hypothetical protein n=1 Tax=unclassified Sodalis (in: enterobacteria) TaxID=2636512 RepID=UPI0039B4030A
MTFAQNVELFAIYMRINPLFIAAASRYDDFGGRRGSIELCCALSGIEQALWDVAGDEPPSL